METLGLILFYFLYKRIVSKQELYVYFVVVLRVYKLYMRVVFSRRFLILHSATLVYLSNFLDYYTTVL